MQSASRTLFLGLNSSPAYTRYFSSNSASVTAWFQYGVIIVTVHSQMTANRVLSFWNQENSATWTGKKLMSRVKSPFSKFLCESLFREMSRWREMCSSARGAQACLAHLWKTSQWVVRDSSVLTSQLRVFEVIRAWTHTQTHSVVFLEKRPNVNLIVHDYELCVSLYLNAIYLLDFIG